MSKCKKTLVVISLIVLAVVCAASCYLALSPSGIGLDFMRFGIYGCYGDDSGIVPSGSAIITDKSLSVVEGIQAAAFVYDGNDMYPSNQKSAFIGTAKMQNGKMFLVKNESEKMEIADNNAEYIVLCLSYGGLVFWALYQFRYLVFAGWICIFGLIVVLLATSPARRRKKYRKQLIETFTFYGEKFDREDQDKDY